MTYVTLMAPLELGHSNARFLKVVGDFAEMFGCEVIGIAASQPALIAFGDGYVPGEFLREDRELITTDFQTAQAEFRSVLESRVKSLEWRSTLMVGSLSNYFAVEARSADILIMKAPSGNDMNTSRQIDCSDVIMQSGRPVLVVPEMAESLKIERVLIAWKDTRETRRAVLDAVPLLMQATSVHVIELTDDMEAAAARGRHVVAWLLHHGIAATAEARIANGDNSAQLRDVSQELDVDVIVAGAYGHSRFREWALGGVTRSLLLRAERMTFFSH